MKSTEVSGHAPKVNNCTCSGWVRTPKTTYKPKKAAPEGAKNVLYILVVSQRFTHCPPHPALHQDDMRPELEAFGQDPHTHHAPHISALAKSGMAFTNGK